MRNFASWMVVGVVIAGCGKSSEQELRTSSAKQPPVGRSSSDAGSSRTETGIGRLKVATDVRIELFSVLFGFANAQRYGRGTQTAYIDAMAKHFKPFAKHPAVLATAELRAKYGLGFEVPIKLAVYLDQDLRPIRPLDETVPGLERWKGVDITAYLVQVRAFAADTRFAEFFAAQQPIRAAVEQRFRDFVADKHILLWFDSTFGARYNTTHQIVPAFIVGLMNYGVSAVHSDGREDIVMVMSLENPTGKGFEPGEATLGLVIHEVSHSYVNRVFDARFSEIQPVFAPLFARVEPEMRKQSYPSPQIALNETVVRAVTLLYLRDKGTPDHAAHALAEQNTLSFVWAGPLADALASRRAADGGKLSAAALFETTKTTLEQRATDHPAP